MARSGPNGSEMRERRGLFLSCAALCEGLRLNHESHCPLICLESRSPGFINEKDKADY